MAQTSGGGVTGMIMAGGRSRRLGMDKTTMPWPPGADAAGDAAGGAAPGTGTRRTLLEATGAKLEQVCDEVLVVAYRGARTIPYRTAPDLYAEGGSLGGIYSGLTAAANDYALAVATDMPFLSLPLLQWMIAQPRDYDVLVPLRHQPAPRRTDASGPYPPPAGGDERGTETLEPLHAIYAKACLEPMRRRLEAGRLKIAGIFEDVRVRYVEPQTLERLDPEGLSFFNINTPEDLEWARQVLAGPL